MKQRLDRLLTDREMVPSRHRAQALILSGKVLVNDVPVTKAGQAVSEEAIIRLKSPDHPYVSRGGLKLEKALDTFPISVSGRVAMDIGASTGGFSDVLLQRGIQKVFAVDVGKGLLDWKVRSDERVIPVEKTNARYLEWDQIGCQVDLVTVDVSFISITKIFSALFPFVTPKTDWITLIKPQFEARREDIGKGGVIRDETVRQNCLRSVQSSAETHGLILLGLVESPITGADGNKEFLAHWRKQTKDFSSLQ